MKLIYRNIIKTYINPFIYSILFCTFIFVLGEILQIIQDVYKYNSSIKYVFKYYQYYLPFIIVNYVLPICCLLAVFFSIGIMLKNKELIIYRAIGMSSLQIFTPIFIIVFLITCFSFFMIYFYLPDMYKKAKEVYTYKIKNLPVPKEEFDNVIIYLSSEYFLKAKKFLPAEKKFIDVSIIKTIDFISFDKRYDAEFLVFKNNNWYLLNGKIRYFKNELVEEFKELNIPTTQIIYKTENFNEIMIAVNEKPDELLNILRVDKKRVEEIRIDELIKLIKYKKIFKSEYNKSKVQLYNKFANSLRNISLTFIGLPIALKSSSISLSGGFGISLLLSFVYWILSSITFSLGLNEILSPVISAFIIDFLFIFSGIYFFIKIKNDYY
ncbi:MAG TPA: LptF/LptG family permease [bacterium]|nr:LptF/LptG family permease [bacterium]HOL47004.1 LptF/LptG family permease [bacterium]HPQ19000.1 LptF/LptG family permease [bacterium]